MNFTFETNIKESKGAINTAAKIAEILSKSQVSFGKTKDNVPGIWVQFEGSEKSHWIACRICTANIQMGEYARTSMSGEWWKTYAKDNHNTPDAHFLFTHLTDAAEQLVKSWIESLIDQYQNRIDNDAA